MILKIAGAFLAVVAFCFILNTPRRRILHAGLCGAAGWAVYLILEEQGFSIGSATFFSGCLISLLAQIFARVFKTPVTVFVIPGILPLVPGAGMYRIVDAILRSDGTAASHYVTQTLITAGMIAMSILIMDSIFRVFIKPKGERNHVDSQ